MKNIFRKISKRMFYLLLLFLSLLFLFLAKVTPNILSDLFVNLSAGFIGSLITIAFIDTYFSSQKTLEKEGILKMFTSELDDLVTRYLLNLVQIFNVEMGAILGDLGHLVDSPKDIHLTLIILIKKDLEKEDVKQWDKKFLTDMNRKFDDIKQRFSRLKEYYSYGVISDTRMKTLIELEALTKKPLFLTSLEMGIEREQGDEEKWIRYDDFMKKDIMAILTSLDNLIRTT